MFSLSKLNIVRMYNIYTYIYCKIKAEDIPQRPRMASSPPPGRRETGDGRQETTDAPHRGAPLYTRTAAPAVRETIHEPPHPAPTSRHTEDQIGPHLDNLHVASPPAPKSQQTDAKCKAPRATLTTTAIQNPHHEEDTYTAHPPPPRIAASGPLRPREDL